MKQVTFDFSEFVTDYYFKESFKTLRTNFLFSDVAVKTVLFTSCDMGEGKTTVCLGLGYSLSEMGKRVLILDTDLRKSGIAARYTDGAGVSGLSELLSGQATLEDVLCHTQKEGFDIIFAGKYPPNPVELLGSESLKTYMADFREKYDYVLVDASPLGLVVDSAVVGAVCDGAILVLASEKDKYRFAQAVVEQLKESGCRVLGVVLNHNGAKKRVETYYRRDAYADKKEEKEEKEEKKGGPFKRFFAALSGKCKRKK